MVPAGEHAEDAIVADAGNGKDGDQALRAMGVAGDDDAEHQQQRDGGFSMRSLLWHGGSVWDAWFSCASNQVPSWLAAAIRCHGCMVGRSPVRCVLLAGRWRRCC